jgi:hypothetical protein
MIKKPSITKKERIDRNSTATRGKAPAEEPSKIQEIRVRQRDLP